MGKVLITASTWGHIRSFHLPYLRELKRLGWEVHVGCPGIPEDAPYIDQPVLLPFEKRTAAPANFRAAHILRQRIKAEHYDLIITHTTLAAFFTRLAVKGMKRRPRLINVMHGYLFDEGMSALKRGLLLKAEQITAGETDLLLTMNAWDEAAAKKYRLGARIVRIPGVGADFSRLDAADASEGQALREKLGIPKENFVLIFPAEFSVNKSQSVLIRAMRMLPERVTLVLCGVGRELEACKTLAAELRLDDRVLFPGYVTDMAKWYRMADAAVSASRKEGLPFNVMEAMHLGLPVVASAAKGNTDLVQDGVTGFLYPYGDAEACAACIRRLLEDPELCRSLGEKAKEAAEPYALERVLPLVMEHYLGE